MTRPLLPTAALTLALLTACGQAPSDPMVAAAPLAPLGFMPFGTRQFGTQGSDAAGGVAVDALGNVYAAGLTQGPLFGQTPLGGLDAYVVKFDPRGAVVWARLFGTARDDEAAAVELDASGNVYVAGTAGGVFGASGGVEEGDAFLSSFDGQGRTRWSRRFGDPVLGEQAVGLAVDSLGQAYVVGAAALAGSVPGNAGFAHAYSPSGTLRWETRFQEGPFTLTFGVAPAPGGDVFVAGNGNFGAAGDFDAFLTRLSGASGERRWTQRFGGAGTDLVRDVAADALGNAYVIGGTDGALDGANAGAFDSYVASFDARGARRWTRQFGNASDEFGFGGSVDELGNVYVVGYTGAGLFGQPAVGGLDAYLVGFDRAGARRFVRQFGSDAQDLGVNVASRALAGVFVSGAAAGSVEGQVHQGGDDAFVKKFDLFGQAR